MLAGLEQMGPDSADFETAFDSLHTYVLAHAEAEEREEFNELAATLDDAQLERMRNAAHLAEQMAPTRPHPGVESAAENMLAGPFAAMMDRARDLIEGKSQGRISDSGSRWCPSGLKCGILPVAQLPADLFCVGRAPATIAAVQADPGGRGLQVLAAP